MTGDQYRWCVHCGADCHDDEPGHGTDCPATTGLWPVTSEALGMRGHGDPYAHGMACMDCGAAFNVGDVYAHQQIGPDVFEVV